MVADTLADGFGTHGRSQHRQQRGRRFRQGRTGDGGDAGAAPLGGYGAGDDSALGVYEGGAADDAGGADADNLAMLEKSVPGIPGEDYPIYAEVPETAFVCDGQVDGGM